MNSTFATAVVRLLVVVATAISAACGDGSSTSVTPASPTGVRASNTTGAVITGRVNSVSAAPSTPMATDRWSAAVVSTMATTSLTVTIVGTSVTSRVDGTGQFTLTGVPPGTVQLRFSGPGNDATVTLTGVEADDRIEINVTLNGNRARLDSDRRSSSSNGVLVNGRITGINTGARSLEVGSQTVLVPTTAVIRHGNRTLQFSDLRMGDHIQVKGTRAGSTITATEVKVEPLGDDEDDDDDDDEDDDRDDDRQTELSGIVSGRGGTCPSITFTVRNTIIRTNGATDFRDACSLILNTLRVEVRGTREANGQILASRVELDD
jgi:hypothetical protein